MIIRALIVEDSEDDARLVAEELLRSGCGLIYERVETAKEMSAALKEQKWDIVISDYSMPKFDGFEALKLLKECGQKIPFVLISGNISTKDLIKTIKAGAHDFIAKEDITELAPLVKREVVFSLMENNKKNQGNLQKSAEG